MMTQVPCTGRKEMAMKKDMGWRGQYGGDELRSVLNNLWFDLGAVRISEGAFEAASDYDDDVPPNVPVGRLLAICLAHRDDEVASDRGTWTTTESVQVRRMPRKRRGDGGVALIESGFVVEDGFFMVTTAWCNGAPVTTTVVIPGETAGDPPEFYDGYTLFKMALVDGEDGGTQRD